MNILYITADQWRAECLSVLGHLVQTPNLDALAADAVLFRQHYTQSTPCAPARCSMHTGMYVQNHRCVTNGTPLDRRFTNWALEVNKLGYDPSLFGYTDTASDPRGMDPNDPRLAHYSEPLPGFGYYTPEKDEVSLPWLLHLVERGYAIPENLVDLYGIKKPGTDWVDGGEFPLPLAIDSEDHTTHVLVDKCIEWIKAQREPWITHLSLFRPHPPFVAPEPYNRLYNPADLAPPLRCESAAIEAAQHPLLEFMLKQPKFRWHDSLRADQQEKAHYLGLLTEVDDNLGRLFEQLKASGQWDSTLIIFSSDHGEQMGDHWLFSKQGYFDQSYHIPLIIRDPSAEADATRGQQVDGFSENVDMMPTMLDWLGAEIPSQCDGRSLIPAVREGKMPAGWREEAHWEYDFRNVRDDSVEKYLGLSLHQCCLAVIRDNAFKYVHFGGLPPLLFDLEQDPGEFVNQAENPKYREKVLEYSQKMLTWKMVHAERGLTETSLGEGGPVTRRVAARVST